MASLRNFDMGIVSDGKGEGRTGRWREEHRDDTALGRRLFGEAQEEVARADHPVGGIVWNGWPVGHLGGTEPGGFHADAPGCTPGDRKMQRSGRDLFLPAKRGRVGKSRSFFLRL